MSKIRLLTVSCLTLIFLAFGSEAGAQEKVIKGTDQFGCREVQVQCIQAPCPVKIICSEPPVQMINCGWCGQNCTNISASGTDMACPMIAPPVGKYCMNVGGQCRMLSSVPGDKSCSTDANCGPNEYCYQPPMPVCKVGTGCTDVMPSKVCRSKTTAGEGEMCGGIAGIMCMSGLRCDYGTNMAPRGGIIPDASGVCVKDTPTKLTPTPFVPSVTAETRCEGSQSKAIISVDIKRLDVWMVIESVLTSEKVIYNYSKNGSSLEIGPNINSGILTGIRRGSGYAEQLKINAGESYVIRVFTAPYTLEVPSNWTSIGEAKILMPKCQTTGDANGDGKVDLADFAVWKSEYLSRQGTMADFDKNGIVNLGDFATWKNAFLNVTPTIDKKIANEGQMCGGIAGIMCNTGLRCNYGTITGGADRSGVCVSANYPTPFGPPVKEGDLCGGPKGYNCDTSLGLECYRGSGPITTATVGVCRKVLTADGTRICSGDDQCYTNEYCGYPIGAVIPQGQSPARACFKKPIPTIQ